jgi:hypothetical protein
MRIGDANLNRLKAWLILSVRYFRRVWQTYRTPFSQAPEVRRRFFENRRARGAMDANWRCECESFESTVDAINKALSASLSDISKTILASP